MQNVVFLLSALTGVFHGQPFTAGYRNRNGSLQPKQKIGEPTTNDKDYVTSQEQLPGGAIQERRVNTIPFLFFSVNHTQKTPQVHDPTGRAAILSDELLYAAIRDLMFESSNRAIIVLRNSFNNEKARPPLPVESLAPQQDRLDLTNNAVINEIRHHLSYREFLTEERAVGSASRDDRASTEESPSAQRRSPYRFRREAEHKVLRRQKRFFWPFFGLYYWPYVYSGLYGYSSLYSPYAYYRYPYTYTYGYYPYRWFVNPFVVVNPVQPATPATAAPPTV